jgi:hypothetical protein
MLSLVLFFIYYFVCMLKEKSKSLCGYGYVAFLATAQSLGNLPQPLTASGKPTPNFQLPMPTQKWNKFEVHRK